MSAATDKQPLRTHFLALRRRLSPEESAQAAVSAFTCLTADPVWQNARSVALYMAVRAEIDASPLLRAAESAEKTILLPRCLPDQPGIMHFIRYTGPESLRPGPFGIPEPTAEAAVAAAPPELVLVPGLAYDNNGYRLGAGGGYYDRFFALPANAGCIRIGYAYSIQLTESLPREPWDLPMHAVCSDKGLVWIQRP